MTSTIFALQNHSMSGEQQYASMQEIAALLKDKISELESGSASVDELDSMVNKARELYERLVVLRHKAFDTLVEKEEEHEPMPFKLESVDEDPPTNQTSLIDVIKEVERQDDVVEITDEVELVLEKIELAESPVENEVIEVSADDLIEEEPLGAQSQQTLDLTPDEPDVESLAERLTRTPIADLKRSIALNQKFVFINDLFSGDSEQYESAISSLNAFHGRDEAIAYLEGDLADKLEWEEESEARLSLTELVERRYA